MANVDRDSELKRLPVLNTGCGSADPGAVERDAGPLQISPSGRVIIEIVGVCQAKCPYCAQNSGKARRSEKPQAYMPVPLFAGLIERLAASDTFRQKKIDRVYLYNWGEPFLAPAFNEYLAILKQHGLYAVVSSNFQKVPAIRDENFPVINEVLFSLSGMTQGTYGRIHGGDIVDVLANFEAFNAKMKRFAPRATIFMAWHRYTFNESEFWDAYRYSRTQNVWFIPSVAFLNDLAELIQAGSNRLPGDRRQNAERDLFFEHMVNTIGSYSKGGAEYDCPAWNDVVVDEQGRLLICCGTDSQSAVGRALDMSYEDMREKKIRSGLCKVCKDTGVAEWAHNNHHQRNQLPWPSGGGVDRLRLQMAVNKVRVKTDIRATLDRAPFGETVLDVYRKWKHAPGRTAS